MTKPSTADIVKQLDKGLVTIAAYQQALDDIKTQRDKELAAVNQRYDDLADTILPKHEAAKHATFLLANANRESLPLSGKTLKLRNGNIRWHKHPVSVVLDAAVEDVIAAVRKHRKMRLFTERKITLSKTKLKTDAAFVAVLDGEGLAHFEEVENIAIKLPNRKEEIVQSGNPYKVEVPSTEE